MKEKFKVAFIFCHEKCNPKKDRSVIESKEIIMYSVGCADYSQIGRASCRERV